MPSATAILELFQPVCILLGLLSGMVWLMARKEKWQTAKVLSSFVFAGCTFVAAGTLVFYAGTVMNQRRPGVAFKSAFGKAPPPGTILIHGRQSELPASAGVAVTFQTDYATFVRLRPRTLKRVTLEGYQSYGIRHPSWWREPGGATEIWMLECPFGKNSPGRRRGFPEEVTVMTWDADGLAQFDWSGS